MIRKAWYALCRSEQLSDRPIKATVHNADIVLFRTSDTRPHAVSAYCPHRGCDLSLGTLTNDRLTCPFHGWQFDQTGQCTLIPANRPEAPIPNAAHVTAYPAQERAGLIWVFTDPTTLEQDQLPPLELFHELEVEGWRYSPLADSWKANFCRVIESVLDISHLPFVHPETNGMEILPVVNGLDYEVSESRIVIHPVPFPPAASAGEPSAPAEMDQRTEIELLFPNRWIIRTPMGEKDRMCTFLTFTPVRENLTQIFGIVMRNFALDDEFLDVFHLNHTRFVMDQDKVIVENLRPVVPPELKQEAHVASDAPGVRYRHMLFEALQMETNRG